MEKVIFDIINHFKKGTGTEYTNKILTEKVKEHENTKAYVSAIKRELNKELREVEGDLTKLKYKEGNKLDKYVQQN